jgi:hypothetical protein
MLHEEGDGIAAAAASEAFIDLLGRRDGERRRLLIVKRTEAKIVGASAFQFYEAAYDLDYIDPAKYLLYGLLGDHYGPEK